MSRPSRCCVLSALIWSLASVAAADDAPAAAAPNARAVTVDVTILDVSSAGRLAGEVAAAAPAEQLQRLRELESQGKVAGVSRMRLATLENQPARAQFGESVSMVVGRQLQYLPRGREGGSPGGNPVSEIRQSVSVGTLVTAVTRVQDDGAIVVALKLERTTPATGKPADGADGTDIPRTKTFTVDCTTAVNDGETQVVSSRLVQREDGLEETWVLVQARANPAPQRAAQANAASDLQQLKIFHLKQVDAADASEILTNLLSDRRPELRMGIDPRRNALVVRGDAQQLQVIEALLLKLDELPAK